MSVSQLHSGESNGIKFSSSFGNKEFRLIEVPEDVFKIIEAGESLKIIGGGVEEAVLCSKDRTYSIKRVESSNSVYFIPPKDGEKFSIASLCSDYYEIKPTLAKFDKLNSLLSVTQYMGFLEEQQSPVNTDVLPTKDSLHKTVQASVAELDVYLNSKDVVEVGGKLRLLSKGAVLEAMSVLFNTILIESWTIDSIDERLCSVKMTDIDSVVVKHVLKLLGDCNGQSWNLDQKKVLSASANLLFNRKYCDSSGKPILAPVQEFLQEWSQMTPGVTCSGPSMAAHETLLRGMALKEISSSSSAATGTSAYSYRYFSVADLSQDPKVRFAQLFAIKPRFQLEELEPYLVGLFGAGGVLPKSQAELLLQHTRCVDNYYILKC